MSHYRVSKKNIDDNQDLEYKKFDNKEDAEHYAKNTSMQDNHHVYVVESQVKGGEFAAIKAYQQGQVEMLG